LLKYLAVEEPLPEFPVKIAERIPALARLRGRRGVPVLLCPQTKTRLFSVDIANEFMMKVGAKCVAEHNASSG
jgi:hypothetical protein